MIRIYLDWNVYSNLKLESFSEIKTFLRENKDVLLFPYSPAHFTDLLKSQHFDSDNFRTDLETLEEFCVKHILIWEGGNGAVPKFGTPMEYYEGEKEKEQLDSLFDIEKTINELNESCLELGLDQFGDVLKLSYQLKPSGIELTSENQDTLKKYFPSINNNSSIWDLMKDVGPFMQQLLFEGDFYKELRRDIEKQGLKVSTNSGNWLYVEVIERFNHILKSKNIDLSFFEYVRKVLEFRKDKLSFFEIFTTSYLLLDMFGYKSDKLPKKTDNMRNIQADAEHSFYAGHCDFFVTSDKRQIHKSKVLYKEFDTSTIILEPSELVNVIGPLIHRTKREDNLLTEILSNCIEQNLVEHHQVSSEREFESFAYKLPIQFFNYFNYVIFTDYGQHEGVAFTLRKSFNNFSRFIFYTEAEKVIDSIIEYLGYDNPTDLAKKKHEIIYGEANSDSDLVWIFDKGMIRLGQEVDTKRPVLSIIISTRISESD